MRDCWNGKNVERRMKILLMVDGNKPICGETASLHTTRPHRQAQVVLIKFTHTYTKKVKYLQMRTSE